MHSCVCVFMMIVKYRTDFVYRISHSHKEYAEYSVGTESKRINIAQKLHIHHIKLPSLMGFYVVLKEEGNKI